MSLSIVHDFTVIRWLVAKSCTSWYMVYPLLIPLFTMFHSYLTVANWRRISDKSTVSLVDTQMKGPILMDFIWKSPCNDDFPTESDACRSGIWQLKCLITNLLAHPWNSSQVQESDVELHWDSLGAGMLERKPKGVRLFPVTPVCLTDARYYKT